MKHLFLFLTAVTVFGSTSFAQEEKIETDRPDQTESPFTAPKNWFQFEAGFNVQRNEEHQHEFLHPTLLTNFGLLHNLELRLITTIKSESDLIIPHGTVTETGLEPVEVGFKLGLFEEKGFIPKTALLFHVAIPGLASEIFDIDKVAPNFRLAMQHSLSKKTSLGYNIGAGWDGESNKVAEFIYSLAPGFNLGDKWYYYAEVFGSFHPDEAPEHTFDTGFAYYVNNDFKVDLSGGVGISKAAPDYYFGVGASVRFNAGKKGKVKAKH